LAASALPGLQLPGQAGTESSLPLMERARRAPGERDREMVRQVSSLGELRQACKKGEQTPRFSLPCHAGPDPNPLKAAEGIPLICQCLKITCLNPGNPAKEGAWDTSSK